MGLEVWTVDEELQAHAIQPAIYDPLFGIKACGRATAESRANLRLGVEQLRSKGAEGLILGCTEIPLALPEKEIEGMTVIDPALILARALIAAVDPVRLLPLP
jgi:aspartate racemase